jgi:hypothetical protein
LPPVIGIGKRRVNRIRLRPSSSARWRRHCLDNGNDLRPVRIREFVPRTEAEFGERPCIGSRSIAASALSDYRRTLSHGAGARWRNRC